MITIALNYKLDFEHTVMDSTLGSPSTHLYHFCYYGLAWFSIAILQGLIVKDAHYLKSKEFWKRSIVIFLFVGFFYSMYYDRQWVVDLFPNLYERYYARKLIINGKKVFVVVAFLFVLKNLWDRKEDFGLYGFHFKKANYWPYLAMLGGMLPLIIWASFQGDFQNTYPQFKPWKIPQVFGLETWQMGLGYEMFYASAFFSVELIFRGLMVLGLVKVMGKHVILPMVVTYAFLHFGKPLAECIGSIFGGYILGIIALKSRSILGGCFIHIGVAMLMDIAAYCQYYYNQ